MAASKRTTGDTLGKRIAQARLSAGARRGTTFTQTELARLLGVTPPTVSQWEAGAAEPALAMIERIAKVFGVQPGALAFGPLYSDTEDVVVVNGIPVVRSSLHSFSPVEQADARARADRPPETGAPRPARRAGGKPRR